MKKIVVLSALIILGYTVSFSQESDSTHKHKDKEFMTLLGNHQPRGFYGAFTVGYSEINEEQAVLFGGRFIWITSHSLGLGFGGSGFINEYHYEPSINADVFLTGGYGGLYIEPILMPRYPVHLSFPILLGAGGISYISTESGMNSNMIDDSEAFLLVEPGAELELNITKFFRMSLGATYRFPSAFNVGTSGTPNASSESIKGFSYMVTFKFGRF
jgi:hypothetical protein